ncbi:MAG TPA: hypothetical protein VH297_13210, partial [Gaiellaceae bacterium]
SDAIGEGAFFQMQTFSAALIDLVVREEVTREVAADAATNRHDFLVALEYALKRRSAAAGEGMTEGEAQRELQRRRVEAPAEGGELELGVPDLRIVRPGL